MLVYLCLNFKSNLEFICATIRPLDQIFWTRRRFRSSVPVCHTSDRPLSPGDLPGSPSASQQVQELHFDRHRRRARAYALTAIWHSTDVDHGWTINLVLTSGTRVQLLSSALETSVTDGWQTSTCSVYGYSYLVCWKSIKMDPHPSEKQKVCTVQEYQMWLARAEPFVSHDRKLLR